MNPFLTVITRCCRRPDMLRDNIQSVQRQSCKDWEQLFLVDPDGRHEDPILWANQQFSRHEGYVSGEYVCALDDDGVLIDENAFAVVKETVSDEPDVVMVRISTLGTDGKYHVWPKDEVWDLNWEEGERPDRWAGNGYNVYTRSAVWRDHLSFYQNTRGGDWHYITSLLDGDLYIKRADVLSGKSMMRGAGVIFEKCGPYWFDEVAEEFGLKMLAENVWRLTP
jgi:glycosyltransferase involved in cell wall biosynthesis